MKNKKVQYLTQAALVAALYVALAWLSNIIGLASGAVQLRLSEALCVLPYFIASSIPGLFIGCIIANLTMGCAVWDIIFGSIATLIGAAIASKIKNKYLVPIPTVVSNAIIVPVVIMLCYTVEEARNITTYAITAAGVIVGEIISAYVLGLLFLLALNKHKRMFL